MMTIAPGAAIVTDAGTRVYDTLLISHHGGRVVLEQLEAGFQVRALVQLGHDPSVARVFGYSGAERGKVIGLAVRKGLIEETCQHD